MTGPENTDGLIAQLAGHKTTLEGRIARALDLIDAWERNPDTGRGYIGEGDATDVLYNVRNVLQGK